MNNTSLFFKLGYKFLVRYFKEYFIVLLKPLLAFILSMVFLPLCFISPFFAIFAIIITIPVSCWAMWRMYVIFYAIIPTSYEFLKNGAKNKFESIIKNINQKELISFAGFSCLIYLIPCLILISCLASAGFSTNISETFNNSLSLIVSFFLTIILIIPFASFGLQAFYFKREDENCIDVLKNCYKYFNTEALLIIILLSLLGFIANLINFIAIFAWIFLTPYTFAVYTLWYYSRLQKKN